MMLPTLRLHQPPGFLSHGGPRGAPCGLVQASVIFRSSSADFLPLQEREGKGQEAWLEFDGETGGAKAVRTSSENPGYLFPSVVVVTDHVLSSHHGPDFLSLGTQGCPRVLGHASDLWISQPPHWASRALPESP